MSAQQFRNQATQRAVIAKQFAAAKASMLASSQAKMQANNGFVLQGTKWNNLTESDLANLKSGKIPYTSGKNGYEVNREYALNDPGFNQIIQQIKSAPNAAAANSMVDSYHAANQNTGGIAGGIFGSILNPVSNAVEANPLLAAAALVAGGAALGNGFTGATTGATGAAGTTDMFAGMAPGGIGLTAPSGAGLGTTGLAAGTSGVPVGAGIGGGLGAAGTGAGILSGGVANAAGGSMATGLGTSIASALGLPKSAGSFLDQYGNTILSTGLNLAGANATASQAQQAAQSQADAQIRAAQIAADAAKFKPVGVTTNFGSSNFGYDANGNLISAGYNLSPQLQAQQAGLLGLSDQALAQTQQAQAASAPLSSGAKSAMSLGQQYLATSPQEQAAKYMQEQQALLAGSRASDLAAIQSRLAAQGRTGLSIGGGGGMTASNPELQAYYNAINQQNLQLAADATKGGQQYTQFGTGLIGTGADLLNAGYGVQTNAVRPYTGALGAAQNIEALGQNALDIGTGLGSSTTAAASLAGQRQAQGITGAASTMAPANAYSPIGAGLLGAAQAVGQYGQPMNSQYKFDPFTGRAL